MFAVLFAALFLAERTQKRRGSIEQMALLPLDEAGRLSVANHTPSHSHD
jgi:hypothetical protein